MPLSSEHAAMALQIRRKSVGLDRTVDRNFSQSRRTRILSALAMAIAIDMIVVLFEIVASESVGMLFSKTLSTKDPTSRSVVW